MKISVDAEYLEELEKKAKRHDFFEGYIKGIEVAFAFAEELVKDIGNRKTEPSFKVDGIGDDDPTIHAIAHLQKVGWLQEHDRALTDPRTCETCKFADKEWYEEPCDRCGYMERYEPKTEPQTDCVKVGKWYSFTDYIVEMQGDSKLMEFRIVPQTEVRYSDSTDYQGAVDYVMDTDCSWK